MFKRAKENLYLTESSKTLVSYINVFTPAYAVSPGDVVLQLPCVKSWEMTAEEAGELGRALKESGVRSKGKTIDCRGYAVSRGVYVYGSTSPGEVILQIGEITYHLSGTRAYDLGCTLLNETD